MQNTLPSAPDRHFKNQQSFVHQSSIAHTWGDQEKDHRRNSKPNLCGCMETLPQPTEPACLVGSYRSFAEFGPVYQITSRVNGQKVHVVVVQTGKELDYPIEQAMQDPAAR